MHPQTAKEIRQMLPMWLTTAGLLLLAVYFRNGIGLQPGLLLLAIGSVVIAVSTFGSEFGDRTIGLLLVQPVPRSQTWLSKMTVTGIGLLLLGGLAWGVDALRRMQQPAEADSFIGPELWWIWVVILCAWATGPTWGMAVRRNLSGVVLALGVPWFLWALLALFGLMFHPVGRIGTVYLFILLVYSALLLIAGRVLFRRLEVVDTAESSMEPDAAIERMTESVLAPFFGLRGGPIARLIKKELYLHQTVYLSAILFCVIEAIALVAMRISEAQGTVPLFMVPFVIYAVLVPIMAGAMVVAEERNLGVHASNLMLPISGAKQWIVKVLVALAVSLLFGIILPFVWLGIGHSISKLVPWPDALRFGSLITIVLVQASVTAAAIYGSSISGNTLRAAVIGLALCAIAGIWFAALISFGAVSRATGDVMRQIIGNALPSVALIVLLFYSFRNYRMLVPSAKEIAFQTVAVVAVTSITFVLALMAAAVLTDAARPPGSFW